MISTPFGSTGRARGEHDVRQVAKARDPSGIVGAATPHLTAVAVEHDEHAGVLRQHGRQALLRQQDRHLGVLEHERLPLPGVLRIERHVGATGLEHAEQRRDHLRRPLHQHADEHVGTDTVLAQVVRDLVGPAVELGKRERTVRAGDRGRGWTLAGLARHQLVHAQVVVVGLARGVGLDQQRALGLGQHRVIPDLRVGILGARREQLGEVLAHARDGVLVEQVAVVFEQCAQPVRALPEAKREVELRGDLLELDLLDLQVTDRDSTARLVDAERELEQRIAAGIPLRAQLDDELLERHLLVLVSLDRALAHAAQALAEARVLGEVRPQHEAVDEQADQRLGLDAVAVGDRRAHDDVVAVDAARDPDLVGRQHRHEEGAALFAPDRGQAVGDRLGNRERAACAAERLDRRTRPIGRELQRRGVRQPVPPELQQLLRLGVVPIALPRRVIRVLDRQLVEGVLNPGDARAVELMDLVPEHAVGPAVPDEMRHGDREQVVVGSDAHQQEAVQRSLREIESLPRGGRRRAHARGTGIGVRRHVDDGQVDLPRRGDDLDRLVVAQRERGAQRLVPADDLAEAPPQRIGIERAA